MLGYLSRGRLLAGRLARRLTPRPRPRRSANIFSLLAAVAIISLISAGAQFAIVVHRESQLANRYSDSLWWFTAQFRSELQQLHISVAGFDGSEERLEDVHNRYDILVSRVGGWRDSTLDAQPGPDLEAVMKELCREVERIGPRVAALRLGDVGEAQSLSRDIFAFDRLAGRMATLGAQADGTHRASVRAGIDQANLMFGGALALLIGSLLLSLRAVNQQAHARDVARRRSEALSADLAVALAQAQSGLRAKDAFLATMSHEIRTPMNGVLGAVSLLSQSALDDRQRRWVAIVKACGETLLAQLDDVLDFSAIQAASVRLEYDAFDIRALADEVARVVESAAAAQALDLVVVVDPDVPRQLVSDRRRVAQVLLNLLSNAVKFTARGGASLRVSLRRRQGRVWLRAAVADSGSGIPRCERRRIFEEFTRLDRSGGPTVRGTGLGLAISQRLATALGGRIRVAGLAGGGSLFCLTIPVDPAGDAELPAPAPTRIVGLASVQGGAACVRRGVERLLWAQGYATTQSAATDVALCLRHTHLQPLVGPGRVPVIAFGPGSGLDATITAARLAAAIGGRTETNRVFALPAGRPAPAAERNLRLLLADDDAINREIAASLLRHLGHDVITVADGQEALAALSAKRFDAGLVDLSMPRMSGFELARAVRALPPPGGAVRLIAVTADAAAETGVAARAAGIDSVLIKPVTLERLAAALRFVGDRSEAPAPAVAGAMDGDSERGEAGAGAGAAQAATPPARPVIAVDIREVLIARLPPGRLPRLVQSFWGGVPALLDALGRDDRREADRRLHSLAGAAGSLGYARVCDGARGARAALQAADAVPAPAAQRSLAELRAALQAALRADAASLAPSDVEAMAARLEERAAMDGKLLEHAP